MSRLPVVFKMLPLIEKFSLMHIRTLPLNQSHIVMYTPTNEITEIIELFSKDHLNLVLVAENTALDLLSLIEEAKKNGIQIAGGIFPGLIHDCDRQDRGLIIQYLDINSKVSVDTHLTELKSQKKLPEWSQEYHSALILIDGLSAGISNFLESVYEFYGNKLTYVGAGCGSLSLMQKPCLFTNDGVFFDAAILIMLSRKMTIGVKHGWKRIAGPFIANKTTGNVLHEINWEAAFDVYSQKIAPYAKIPIDKSNFFEIAKGFPFGILREGYEDVVRDPVLTNDEQTLTCVGEVANNTSVNILKGESEDLIRAAEEATLEAIKYSVPRSAFVVDCISRSLFLEDNFVEELKVVNNVLSLKNEKLTLEGVLSLGEISSYGDGYIEFFNKTIVVAAMT